MTDYFDDMPVNDGQGDESHAKSLVDLNYVRRQHYLEQKHAELAASIPSAVVAYANACMDAGMPESLAMSFASQYHDYILATTSNLLDAAYIRTMDPPDID